MRLRREFALAAVLLLAMCAFAQTAPQNARIIFYRPRSDYGNAWAYHILVDNQEVGGLNDGHYFSLTVAPGPHLITLPNSFYGKNRITDRVPPLRVEVSPGGEAFVRLYADGCRVLDKQPGFTWTYACDVSMQWWGTPARDEIAKLQPERAELVRDPAHVSLEAYKPPAAPSPPAVAATGELQIHVSPGSAQVYLNDEPKGITSEQGRLKLPDLKPGEYSVRVDLLGYKELTRTIRITADRTIELQATLEPAGPKPLSEPEVEKALRDGIPKPRVEGLIKEYGVDFALTDAIEQQLRAAGADDSVILAVMKNKK